MGLLLYVATTNAGKIRDFEAMARSLGSAVLFQPLPGLRDIPAPPEDGATFAENARSKAMAYSRYAPGCRVLADDSGLEVDALDGAPGVRSARYAMDAGYSLPARGEDAVEADLVDTRNNLFLLENLRGVAAAQRTARYRCVLAVAQDGVCVATGEGTVEGRILAEPRGDGGFGYDPLFLLEDRGQTMAEIGLKEKQAISHRGKAMLALLRVLGGE